MTQSLAEALPDAIAKVSEWIGKQEAEAAELDAISPGAGKYALCIDDESCDQGTDKPALAPSHLGEVRHA